MVEVFAEVVTDIGWSLGGAEQSCPGAYPVEDSRQQSRDEPPASAQLVPRPEHALRSVPGR
jgi:hypothetical protein